MEAINQGFKLFQKIEQDLDPGLGVPGHKTQRRRTFRKVFRQGGMVHVEPDANNKDMDPIQIRLDLGKDARHLLAFDEEVIRPFDIGLQPGLSLYRIVKCYCTAEREEWSKSGGNIRVKYERKIQPRICFGIPGASHATASSGLRLRQYQCSVRDVPVML